ncbi:DUF1361 domain-containing protein [Clostridium lundense]|uniref:DUF1361 domain-containing protein n=1 Tax=Clostridium lundense TaxID=319475 RepID=UPI00047FFBBA|nr:DUF1361 domain-containing protein [Clostridium lundense]
MSKCIDKIKRIKNYLMIITLLYFIWILFGGNLKQIYMIWNVILAWIPLEIAILIYNLSYKGGKKKSNKIIIFALGIIWLIFYPNSPYITTDYIHLSTNKYYFSNPNYKPYSNVPRVIYNKDFSIWFDFINIGIGVWLGYIVGFLSLYLNQNLIRKHSNKFFSWIFVVVVNILSGFAIYLGRFIRWNSWDVIVNPKNFIVILISHINNQSLYYTMVFGIFSFTLYLINYFIIDVG